MKARLSPGFKRTYAALTSGRYMTALRTLPTETGSLDWERTLRLWALNAVDPWGSAWEVSGPGAPFDFEGAALTRAESVVGEAIVSRRAVVIMEVHRGPETVRYGARLLPVLRAAGATHFAFETNFQKALDRFHRSGVFRPDTVTYGFDPARATLLRTALSLGLELVAFDFPSEGLLRASLRQLRSGSKALDPAQLNRRREEYMAENVAAVLRQRRDSKVVVWTGEQHAMKRVPPEYPWHHPLMAANLGRLLGEEPFCVGQHLVDVDALASMPRLVGGTHPWAADRGLDAVILHHRGRTPGSPVWLTESLARLDVEPNGAALVQGIPEAEGVQAVPEDQRLSHDQPCTLFLRPGGYLLRGLGVDDSETWRRGVDA